MESAAVLWRRLPHVLAETTWAAADLEGLGRLLGALDESCRRYDEGDDDEVLRLAETVVALVHDSAAADGLLSRLALKSHLPWADGTLPGRPSWMRASLTTGPIPIVSMLTVSAEHGSRGDHHVPAYTTKGLGEHWVPFAAWWESPRIYLFPDVALARRDLVLHESYSIPRLGDAGEFAALLATPGHASPLRAAIRQVAEEVRFTLRATLRPLRPLVASLDETRATRHPLSAPRS